MYFDELKLNDNVLDALEDMHFETCTPIQENCIPPILEGRDVLGIAQTGTGKTAAYLLPVLSMLDDGGYPEDACNCLIMAPTRELAQQIDQAMQGFSYYLQGVSSIAVYGGNDGNRYDQELKSLTMGADVIIATPGRLISHMSLGNVDFSKVSFFILDEADRMLDMGFSDDILKIVSKLPTERQTILFSATMPQKIGELARTVMRNPVEVRLAVAKPAEGIRQGVYICREADKDVIVRHIFAEHTPKRVIVFCSSKQKVKELNLQLKNKGYNCRAMHSDLEQRERDEVMLSFKAGHTDILVATDIVSRGIDIDDITLVLNYDAPRDPEDYVHRIGRTARAGREGRALTLVSERDMPRLRSIEHLLEKKVPREALPEGLKPPTLSHRDQRSKHDYRRRNNFRATKKDDSKSSDKRRRRYGRGNKGNAGAKRGGEKA